MQNSLRKCCVLAGDDLQAGQEDVAVDIHQVPGAPASGPHPHHSSDQQGERVRPGDGATTHATGLWQLGRMICITPDIVSLISYL